MLLLLFQEWTEHSGRVDLRPVWDSVLLQTARQPGRDAAEVDAQCEDSHLLPVLHCAGIPSGLLATHMAPESMVVPEWPHSMDRLPICGHQCDNLYPSAML